MTTDDFGEGVLGLFPGVTRQQFHIVVAHAHFYITAGCGNPPKNFLWIGRYARSQAVRVEWLAAPRGAKPGPKSHSPHRIGAKSLGQAGTEVRLLGRPGGCYDLGHDTH